MCTNPEYAKPTVIYRGPNASEKFIECLLEERDAIETVLEHTEPMNITKEQELEFQRATHCGICDEPFEEPVEDKVRDPRSFNRTVQVCSPHGVQLIVSTSEVHTGNLSWSSQFR